MKKVNKRRIEALALAVTLGFTSVVGYGRVTKKVYAEEPETIVFAQGEGTGSDFQSTSWNFSGRDRDPDNVANITELTEKSPNGPGIVSNDHSQKGESIIRLINGVKEATQKGLEASDSYNHYRTGEAFLKDPIKLNSSAQFSMKFTFSMPDAVVNPGQTNGEKYAREVGGDGIAFVMTTNKTHTTMAGSGIGYEGIGNSLAIEMDSFWNGAYCYLDEASGTASKNWGFDNQAYFHENWDYNNLGNNYSNMNNPYLGDDGKKYVEYRNYDYNERFDHIGITLDGDTKKHEAIKYINNDIDPTELETLTDSTDGHKYYKFKNLAYFGIPNTAANSEFEKQPKGPTNTEDTTNTCSTRFTDKGVDNRLFTVWVDYDGENIEVRYANGDYESAQRPKDYAIQQKVDLSKFESQDIYMGFTSAVGSSKANHTIHSFYFTNRAGKANYKLEYYLKDKETGDYILKTTSEVKEGDVGAVVNASSVDTGYMGKFSSEGYSLSKIKTQEDSVTLENKGETYTMRVYYDPDPTYQLHYMLYNPDTGKYEEKTEDASDILTGDIGDTYKASDVDKDYADKYTTGEQYRYELSADEPQKDSVTLEKSGEKYDMYLYYTPQTAKYKLNYHKYNSSINDYEKVESTDEETGYVGKEYSVTDIDPDYGTKYQNFTVNTAKNETFKVTLEEKNKVYEMDVYYDPEEAGYKLNYHKLNPDTEQYEYVESTTPKKGEVGKTYTVTDADASYESKYASDGYTVNPDKNEKFSVTIDNKDTTYEMDVYYDPPKTTYKTEYYLKHSDGTVEKKDETVSPETYAGKTVNATEKEYLGYTHVTVPESLETAVVNPDGSTTLKVYYEENKDPVYKTEYYVQQEDGTYKLYTDTEGSGKAGEEVTADIINIDGYEHVDLPDLSHEKDTVKEDSSTVLKVYYNIIKSPVYKVEYYVQQEDGTYKLHSEVPDIKGTEGEEVQADIIDIDGYVHTTTPDSLEKDTVKADNSTVLKVYYDKVKSPVYTVQYYVQQKDGTYKLYKEQKDITATAGETVKADIIDIDGYVHTITDDSNEEDVVESDDSTVLKVYYDIEEEPTEEPTTEPPTEEPTTEEPTTEEPTTEKPAPQPTTEEPTTPQPTTKAPVKEVKTGDSASNSLFVMLFSAMVVAYGCFFGRKKKHD